MSIVYILTNEAMPGLIKIGRTNTSVEQRLSELNRHAGIPLPFECYYAAKVNDSVFVERKLHEAFDDNRVRQQREFFRLSPYKAQCALEIGAIEDVTPRDEIFDDTYGGYFLWIDENKDIRIYDNIKKTFFNSDTNQKITFMYDDKKYDCIENTLKEMLFDLFVKLNK